MNHTRSTLIIALALIFLAGRTHAADTVTVKKVTSATTFITSTGQKISLLGLAAARSQAVTAEDARTALAVLIEGQRVVVMPDTAAGSPAAGTAARFVYAGSGLVNLEMIATGYALAAATPAHSHLVEFKAAEKAARLAHEGAFATERATSVQCSATTQKGTRCSRMTTNLNGRCWQHQ